MAEKRESRERPSEWETALFGVWDHIEALYRTHGKAVATREAQAAHAALKARFDCLSKAQPPAKPAASAKPASLKATQQATQRRLRAEGAKRALALHAAKPAGPASLREEVKKRAQVLRDLKPKN